VTFFQIFEIRKIRKLSRLTEEDVIAWEEGLYSTVLFSLDIGSYLARIVAGQGRTSSNASDMYSRSWPFWMLGATPVTPDSASNFHINPLNAELNHICHLLALLGGATIVVVSRLRVKVWNWNTVTSLKSLRHSFVILHVPFDAAASSLNTP